MAPALKVMLGPDAVGLSANTVSRLKGDWAKEYDGWRDVAFDDEPMVIPPFLTGCSCRTYAAIFSFWAGVMPPMPIFGRSLL